MAVSPGPTDETMRKFWLTFDNDELEKEYRFHKMKDVLSPLKDEQFVGGAVSCALMSVGILFLAFGGVLESATAEVCEVAALFTMNQLFVMVIILYQRRQTNIWTPEYLTRNPFVMEGTVLLSVLILPVITLLFLNTAYVQTFECNVDESTCSWAAADCSRMWDRFKVNETDSFELDLRGTFHKEFAFWFYVIFFFDVIFAVSVMTQNKLSVFYTLVLATELIVLPVFYAFYNSPGFVYSSFIIAGAFAATWTLKQIASFQDEARRIHFLLVRKQSSKIKTQSVELRRKSADIREKNILISETKEKLAAAQRVVSAVMKNDAVLRQYAIAFADLVFEQSIGEGSFGTVMKGILRGSKAVAIKTMRVNKVTKEIMEKFKSEIIIMTPLKHPNLIQMYGAVFTEGPDKLCIVLEFAENGSLLDVLTLDVELEWAVRFEFAHGTALCFRYLHHELPETLIHRDLKPANILVDGKMQPKVADFGESRRFDHSSSNEALTMTLVGTANYMAPEIICGEKYTKSVDVFSFALVLLEILIGDAKYVRTQMRSVSNRMGYVIGWRPAIPPSVQEEYPALTHLICSCWSSNAEVRPNFLNIAPEIEARREEAVSTGSNPTSSTSTLLSPEDEEAIKKHFESSSKTFTFFLSHHKIACASDARIVKDKIDAMIGKKSFLDSDNLRDLRSLLDHVIDSDVLVLFQSKEVLQRPWCLLELYTAITEGVPIVALNCTGKEYNFAEAADFLFHLEASLKTCNPGALGVLAECGVEPIHVSHALSTVIPNIISIPFNTSASENAIKASMADLAKAARVAKAMPVKITFEEWKMARDKKEDEDLMAVIERGTVSLKGGDTIRGTIRGRMLQKLELVDYLKTQLAKAEARESEVKAKAEAREAMLIAQLDKSYKQLEKKDSIIEKLLG